MRGLVFSWARWRRNGLLCRRLLLLEDSAQLLVGDRRGHWLCPVLELCPQITVGGVVLAGLACVNAHAGKREVPLEKYRNIGIMAHIDAGKVGDVPYLPCNSLGLSVVLLVAAGLRARCKAATSAVGVRHAACWQDSHERGM